MERNFQKDFFRNGRRSGNLRTKVGGHQGPHKPPSRGQGSAPPWLVGSLGPLSPRSFAYIFPKIPEKNQEIIESTFPPPQASVSARSHLGHVLVPCRRGDSDTEGFFINTMTSPMMREQFTIDLRVHSQQLDGFFSLLDLQYKVLHDLHGDLSDVIFFCGVFVEIR